MGYLLTDPSFMKKFFWHNFISLGLKCFYLMLSGNKLFYKKLKSSVIRSKEANIILADISNIKKDKVGDLLSICVLPSYRGMGTSTELINCFNNVLFEKGMSLSILTVLSDNSRAICFYEKCGYFKYMQSENKICYAKYLA